MRSLIFAIGLMLPLPALAEGEHHLQHMHLAFQAGCTVDTEADAGYCQLWQDAEGMMWLVFYDQPNHIKWIRTGETGDYHYIYQAQQGEPV